MQRTVGQHHADLAQPRRNRIRQGRIRAPGNQHDRARSIAQRGLRHRIELQLCAHALQAVFTLPREHQRQRLVRPVLAGAQPRDGRRIQRIAHQVIAADAFHRDDLAAPQCRDAGVECRTL